jgi:hypothetical protein
MFHLRFPFARVSSFRPLRAERHHDYRLRRWTADGRLARALIGSVGTAAILSAGVLVFGPFSDLSTLQLAAGPHATSASTSAPAPIVLAHTGRAWGAAAQQRQATAASAPLARVARRDEPGVP